MRVELRGPLALSWAVLALALLLAMPAKADVSFNHTSGFGATTTILGQANSSLHPQPFVIEPRDAGGELRRHLISDGQVATPSGGGRVFLTARASATLGTMGGFIRADSVDQRVGGNEVFEDGSGVVKSKVYNACTLESGTLSTGTPVNTALSWKLRGTFSHITPGFNASATLFAQALRPHLDTVTISVVVASSQQSKVDLHDDLALPGIAVGDSFILEPFLHVQSQSTPFINETFIADFEASVLPIVTTPNTDAHWKCAALSTSRLEFAQWEHDHCTDPTVPQQELNVAILPVRARGAATVLSFDEVVERIEYVKDYYFQQSLCSVRLNPITVRDPATDGWMELPRTQAEYESIPSDFGTRATFQRNFNIGADAFAVAYQKDAAFLANQQLGALDAVLVIAAPFDTFEPKSFTGTGLIDVSTGLTAAALAKGIVTDPDVNAFAGGAAAFVAATILGSSSCLLSAVAVEACFAAGGQLANFLSSLKQTLLKQGFAMATVHNPTEIWAHELAHGVFTYWDFYGAAEPFVRGDIGRWGLMGAFPGDNPPSPIIAYNKAIQGWVKFREISAGDWGPDVLVPFKDLRFGARVPRYTPPRGFYDWLIFELRMPPDGVPSAPEQPRPVVPIPVGPSPFTYENNEPFAVRVEIQGGTVKKTTFITSAGRDSDLGTARTVPLRPREGVRVEYTDPPTMRRLDANAVPGIGETGVVVYGKRETRTILGPGTISVHIPVCGEGTIHDGPMFFLDRLLLGNSIPVFNPEFGSCLFKIGNLGEFTLKPGGPTYLDDDAGVELSLGSDLVLSIHESPRSRTVVRMETNVDVDIGGLPMTVVGRGLNESLPVDLDVFTADGRHVRRNHATGVYEFEIPGARAGDVHTPHQWISFPDDVPVSFVVDASEATARARALGVQRFDIEAIVSVIHYDANGLVSDLGTPLTLRLDLGHPTSAPIPITGPVDTTPPATNVTPAPGPNVHGWNKTDVTVTLTATDGPGGSGVAEIGFALSGAQTGAAAVPGSTASVTVSAEGITTLTYFARDRAGNAEAPKTMTIRIDKTAPVVTTARTPAPNAEGWNNTDVTVRFEATDALSGIQGVPAFEVTIGGEGANQSAERTFVDLAGNSTSATVKGINIDRTPPTISAIPSPRPNANGWNNSDVTVNFVATDALSGISSVSRPVTVGAEGGGMVVTGSASDRAGNSASVSITLNIDKTAPELAARCAPPDQSPFLTGRDDLSGVASVARTGSTSVKHGKFKFRQTYQVRDRAGNSLDAAFRVNAKRHETRFGLLSLSYNGAPVLAAEANELECEFALTKSGAIRELEQGLELERQRIRLRAEFERKKNRTTITIEARGVEQCAVADGLVFIGVTTNRGVLGFTFTDAAGTIVTPAFAPEERGTCVREKHSSPQAGERDRAEDKEKTRPGRMRGLGGEVFWVGDRRQTQDSGGGRVPPR